MSLDQPAQNKMVSAPPAKKGFHFASDGIHFAEFIEAATIDEATALYHRIKRFMPGQGPATEQSPLAEKEEPKSDVE
jgi:hypothetical protein